jgi:hypothetical protein
MAKKSSRLEEVNEELTVGVLDQIEVVTDPTLEGRSQLPAVGTEEWSVFVLSQFKDDEVFNGCPNVEGLRRVCEAHYGDVVESVSQVVQSPNSANMNHSCVIHHLTIQCHDGITRRFSGTADVFEGNSDNPMFSWQYSSATCETRAESRAYRRALRLRHVVAQEELSSVPIQESGANGFISNAQKNFLSVNGRRLNINVMKYVSSGRNIYKYANDIPYDVAVKALAHIQQYIRDPSKIKPEWRGFEENWAGN